MKVSAVESKANPIFGFIRRLTTTPEIGVLTSIVVIALFFNSFNDVMLGRENVTVILRTISFIGIVAVGEGILIDFPSMYGNVRAVLERLRIDLPSVRVQVGELSGGQRQAVAIARALVRGRRIFLLDEPTSALSVEQQAKVNQLIRDLKAEGHTVVVISHNLEHVFEVADRVIVVRHGRRVGTRYKAKTTKEEIVGLITGAINGMESG